MMYAGNLFIGPGKVHLLHADELRAELLDDLVAEGVDRVLPSQTTATGNLDRRTPPFGVLDHQDLGVIAHPAEDECSRPILSIAAYLKVRKHLRPPF